MFEIKALDGAFGAVISGLDLHQQLTAEEAGQLVDALYSKHVLVFHDQHLHPSEFARFGRFWGGPIPLFDPRQRDPEHPDLTTIYTAPETPESMRDYAMHWHNDNTYDAVPASSTLLYGVRSPRTGGETMFADMASAYESLPATIKKRIAPLRSMHVVHSRKTLTPGEKKGKSVNNPYSDAAVPVSQPLVIEHPVTGRQCLYGISGSTIGIVGMPEDEGMALLLELKRHATQPCYIQKAKVETGGILMWDNFSVMHSATVMDYTGNEDAGRSLFRCSVRGFPGRCNIQFKGWPEAA